MTTELDTKMMTVFINGESRSVPVDVCVSSLLDWLKIPSDRIAVELNKSIVRKRDWTGVSVFDGAHLEIVEFVGGG